MTSRTDRLIFFWVYRENEDDSPWIIRNPPANFGDLLKEWLALDARFVEEGEDAVPEWNYVNEWLKERGIDIFQPDDEVLLDDYSP